MYDTPTLCLLILASGDNSTADVTAQDGGERVDSTAFKFQIGDSSDSEDETSIKLVDCGMQTDPISEVPPTNSMTSHRAARPLDECLAIFKSDVSVGNESTYA